MSYRSRPAWVYVVLTALLSLLLALVWLGGDSVKPEGSKPPEIIKPEIKAKKTTTPKVVFEDTERMASVKVVEPKHEKNQPVTVNRHGIALILDDVGYDLPALRRALAFPWPMTVAVLPDAPHAEKAATLAHQARHQVMLHMPMEPLSPRYRDQMDDAFIRVGMNREAVRQLMHQALMRVPYVEGVNNHMGSHLTALEEPMRWVMQVCREQKLFFVDSRTNKDSVAARMARQAGLRWAERRVFLDDSVEPEKLAKSWRLARASLAKNGFVIVIAHPHPESLDFLSRLSASDQAAIVPLKQLLFAAEKPLLVGGARR